MLGDLACHPSQLVVQPLEVDEVAVERVLDADRDPLRVQLEPARVDPARAIAQQDADAAGQQRTQLLVGQRGERADRRDPDGAQPLLRLRADAGEAPHVERGEEACLLARYDHGQTARLAGVAADLGHHLARRDPERAGQARPRAHRRLHRLRDDARFEEVAGHLAEVEVALVDAGLLDGRRDPAHGRPDVPGVLAVERVPRAYEHRLRAAADRLGRAHRGVDAEPPRNVVCGGDDATAMRVAADDQRLRPQLGILQLLDRRVEGVEVEVRDDAGDSHAAKRTDRRRR